MSIVKQQLIKIHVEHLKHSGTVFVYEDSQLPMYRRQCSDFETGCIKCETLLVLTDVFPLQDSNQLSLYESGVLS